MRRYIERYQPTVLQRVCRALLGVWVLLLAVFLVGYVVDPAIRAELPAIAFWLAMLIWLAVAWVISTVSRMSQGKRIFTEVDG